MNEEAQHLGCLKGGTVSKGSRLRARKKSEGLTEQSLINGWSDAAGAWLVGWTALRRLATAEGTAGAVCYLSAARCVLVVTPS
jgi:hypothetical protein